MTRRKVHRTAEIRADQRLTVNALVSMAAGEVSWDEVERTAGVLEVVNNGTRDVLTRAQAARFMHLLASMSALFAGALPDDRRRELVSKVEGVFAESMSDAQAERVRALFGTGEAR